MNYDLGNLIAGAANIEPVNVNTEEVKQGGKPRGKQYTANNIQELLSDGYFSVHPALWDHIPISAHIRYIKKQLPGEQKTREQRFKPGGFVAGHMTHNGTKVLRIENNLKGRGKPGYVNFPLAYDTIEEIWKKYDRTSFIEIHLIYTSLMQKKKQIEDLENRLNKIEDILRAVVKQK